MPATRPRIADPLTRDEALTIGNLRRLARAQVKRRVRNGEVDVRDVLASPPQCLLRKRPEPGRTRPANTREVTVRDIITWAPGFGPRRTDKLLLDMNTSSTLAIDDLSPRTLKLLLARLTLMIDGFRCDNGGCDNRIPWVARHDRGYDRRYCSQTCYRQDQSLRRRHGYR
jgi:hypothetical protein